MRKKLIPILSTSLLFTGCTTLPEKSVEDFFEGASANADKRESLEFPGTTKTKRDHKNDLIEDSVSGVLTALFRGIFEPNSKKH